MDGASTIYFPFDFTDKIDLESFKRFIAYPSDMTLKAYHQQDTFKAIDGLLHRVQVSPAVSHRDLKLNLIQGIVRIVKGDQDQEQDLIDILLS
jgi:hypothetical protein